MNNGAVWVSLSMWPTPTRPLGEQLSDNNRGGFAFPLPPTHLCIWSSAGEGRLVVKIPLSLELRYRFRDLGPFDERFLVSKLVVFGMESTAVARVLLRNGRVVFALAFKSLIETISC